MSGCVRGNTKRSGAACPIEPVPMTGTCANDAFHRENAKERRREKCLSLSRLLFRRPKIPAECASCGSARLLSDQPHGIPLIPSKYLALLTFVALLSCSDA